jgi:pSer/pThr/pTyr-binding forkhead associated (FHA) protein
MGEKTLCPFCQKELLHGELYCTQCGKALVPLLPAVVTEPIPENLFAKTEALPDRRKPPEFEKADGIALVVRGSEDPILIAEKDFIIGRYDPDSTQPTVDLTMYNAGALGVSRRHARIQQQGDIYFVEDLNSTNGTWINQSRVPAGMKQGLPNGAILQLGQMVLYFYSSSVEAVRSVEEHIRFKGVATRLTPAYLATRISPYLTALADVQAVGDQMLNRPPTSVEIGAINAGDPQIISVRLTGARDALKLVKGRLILWRNEQSSKIDQVLNLDQKSTPSTAKSANENDTASSAPNGNPKSAEMLRQELRQAEIKLAEEYLRGLAPNKAEDDRKPFVEKLVDPLHVLVLSPLIVLTAADNNAN